MPASWWLSLRARMPLAVILVALVLGGISASGGLLQRRFDIPHAATTVLQGLIFLCVLASNAFAGRLLPRRGGCMTGTFDLGWWGVLLAIVAGAIRVSTPYLLVSLGETLTEKSGRVNLGLEGTLVLGAMSAFATVLSHRLTLARHARCRRCGQRARTAARRHLQSASCQRHRRRHRAVHFRHRPRVLSRQAVHRAARGDAARTAARQLERQSGDPLGL